MTLIDTACHYEKSEQVLGDWYEELSSFAVVTKTPIFNNSTITAEHAQELRTAFERSLHLLRVQCVDGLLVHHAPNLLAPGGEWLFDELIALKTVGLVRQIGVSVYSGDIAEQIVDRFPIDIVQAPINLLDRRLTQNGTLTRLKAKGVEIHARSAFLQGLLLASPAMLPPAFHDVRELLEDFQRTALNAGFRPAQAALHYLLTIPEVSRVLVGVESLSQLNEIIHDFPLETSIDYSCYQVDDVRILDPSCWVS